MEGEGRVEDLFPEGHLLREAVKWIGERRREEPGRSFDLLVDEAGRRFDLTPKDEEFLLRNFRGTSGA
ncbi:MAG TPA: hypothetical protein VGD74_00345 [Vulgatibacter sp.]